MPDKPIDEIAALTEEVVNRLWTPIGLVLAELQPLRDGTWYRFRFDVCSMPSGSKVSHIRLEVIDPADIWKEREERARPGHRD